MFNQRIGDQTLSTLCERVSVAFEVGLDPYRVFDREAESPRRQYRSRMKSVANHVRQGQALSDAIRAQGNYFPWHFAEMVEGGETSGRLDRVLTRLAEYYQQMAEFKLIFRNSILWPIVQLCLGLIVVAGLIYLPEVLLPEASTQRKDLLGIGLIGTDGLIKFLGLVALGLAIVWVVIWLFRNGYLMFLGDLLARVPLVGRMLMIFPEARFVQTLALGIDAGVNASTAISLAFNSAGTNQFESKSKSAEAAIRQGQEMHEVLKDTGLFQRETIEVVELGEASGRLAELLDKHFRLLKIQVRSATAKLTYVASAIIWAMIATALILIIVRVFSLYVDNIGDAAASTIGNSV